MSDNQSVCEEKVYDSLYRAHAEGLRNYLYYKFGDMEKAEDIVQESFLKVWIKCKEILFSKFKPFLYKISNNLMLDGLRKKQVALKFQKTLIKVQDNEDPYFVLRTQEFRAKLESVISELPEKQREAFLMNRIDKLSYKEISMRLGVSETAIEKRISKALIKLKSMSEIKNFKI